MNGLHFQSLRLLIVFAVGLLVINPVYPQTSSITSQADAENWQLKNWELRLAGNDRVPSDEIIKALRGSAAWLIEGATITPDQPDAARRVAKIIEDLILSGYLYSGFADCKIVVEVDRTSKDGTRFEVGIEEGAQYRKGKVRVVSSDPVYNQKLETWLSNPNPGSSAVPDFIQDEDLQTVRWIDSDGDAVTEPNAIWESATIAVFSQTGGPPESAKRVIKTMLTELGYQLPALKIAYDLDEKNKTVDLVVSLTESLIANRIDEVQIEGLQRNLTEDVLRLLSIDASRLGKPNVPDAGVYFDRKTLNLWSLKIWNSARFQEQDLSYELINSGNYRLCIDLKEVDSVPPLSQPLGEKAETFLRGCDWFRTIFHRDEDMLVTMSFTDHQTLQSIASPNGCLISAINELNSDDSDVEHNPPQLGMFCDGDSLSLIHPDDPHVWKFNQSQLKLMPQLSLSLSASEEPDRLLQVGFKLNVQTNKSDHSNRGVTQLLSRPSDWAAIAFAPESETKVADNRMTVSRGDDLIEIEVDTGRILRVNIDRGSIHFGTGLLKHALAEFHATRSSEINLYDHDKPLESLLEFVTSPAVWETIYCLRNTQDEATRAQHKSLKEILKNFREGDWFRQFTGLTANEQDRDPVEAQPIPFRIAYAHGKANPNGQTKFAGYGAYGLRLAPMLFEQNTWPLELAQQASLVLIGEGDSTQATACLRRLIDDRSNGPLCFLTASKLIGFVSPRSADQVMQVAVSRLSYDAFDRDMRTLLAKPALAALYKQIHSLSPSQWANLESLLVDEHHKHLCRLFAKVSALSIDDYSVWYALAGKVIVTPE